MVRFGINTRPERFCVLPVRFVLLGKHFASKLRLKYVNASMQYRSNASLFVWYSLSLLFRLLFKSPVTRKCFIIIVNFCGMHTRIWRRQLLFGKRLCLKRSLSKSTDDEFAWILCLLGLHYALVSGVLSKCLIWYMTSLDPVILFFMNVTKLPPI